MTVDNHDDDKGETTSGASGPTCSGSGSDVDGGGMAEEGDGGPSTGSRSRNDGNTSTNEEVLQHGHQQEDGGRRSHQFHDSGTSTNTAGSSRVRQPRLSEPEVLAVGLRGSITMGNGGTGASTGPTTASTAATTRSSVGAESVDISVTAGVRVLAKELDDQDRQAKRRSSNLNAPRANATTVRSPPVERGTITIQQGQGQRNSDTKLGLARRIPAKFNSMTNADAGTGTDTNTNGTDTNHQITQAPQTHPQDSIPGAFRDSANASIVSNDNANEETKEEEEPQTNANASNSISQTPLIEATLVPQNSQSAIVTAGDAPVSEQQQHPQVEAIEADKVELSELLQNKKLQCFILGLILCFAVMAVIVIVVVLSQTRPSTEQQQAQPQQPISNGNGNQTNMEEEDYSDYDYQGNQGITNINADTNTNSTAKGLYQIIMPPNMQQYIAETYYGGGPPVMPQIPDLNDFRREAFCQLMEQQTPNFDPNNNHNNNTNNSTTSSSTIDTRCTIHHQGDIHADTPFNFTLLYTSATTNVSEYPFLFFQHLNDTKFQQINQWAVNGSTVSTANPSNINNNISFTFLEYIDTFGNAVELGDTFSIQGGISNISSNTTASDAGESATGNTVDLGNVEYLSHTVTYQQVLLFDKWPAWNVTTGDNYEQVMIEQGNVAVRVFLQELGNPVMPALPFIDCELLTEQPPSRDPVPYFDSMPAPPLRRRLDVKQPQRRHLVSDKWEIALLFELTWNVPTFTGGPDEEASVLMANHFHTFMVDNHEESEQELRSMWGSNLHSASPPMELLAASDDTGATLGSYRQRFLMITTAVSTFDPKTWEDAMAAFATQFWSENVTAVFAIESGEEWQANVSMISHTNYGIPGYNRRARRELGKKHQLRANAQERQDRYLQQQLDPVAVDMSFVHYTVKWISPSSAASVTLSTDQLSDLPELFQGFVNDNLESLTEGFRASGFAIASSRPAFLVPTLSSAGSVAQETETNDEIAVASVPTDSPVATMSPSSAVSAGVTNFPPSPASPAPTGTISVASNAPSSSATMTAAPKTTTPSDSPSASPITRAPTNAPTAAAPIPTPRPTTAPTYFPTASSQPSNSNGYATVYAFYFHKLRVDWDDVSNPQYLSHDQETTLVQVLLNYTADYAGRDARVLYTTCQVQNQGIYYLDEYTPYLQITYRVEWSSCRGNVTHLPDLFLDFQVANQDKMSADLQAAGLSATWFDPVQLTEKPAPSFVYTNQCW